VSLAGKLDFLVQSPEAKIFAAFAAAVRADANLVAAFSPIRTQETPKWDAMLSYGTYTMVIQPATVKPIDYPSKRQVSGLTIWISCYLPNEPTEEDSRLFGLNLGGYLRALCYGAAYDDPDNPGIQMNPADTDFRQLATHLTKDESARILTYSVTFKPDVDPTTNDFSS